MCRRGGGACASERARPGGGVSGGGVAAGGGEEAGPTSLESQGVAWLLLRAGLLQPADCFARQQGAVQAHLVLALFPVSRLCGRGFPPLLRGIKIAPSECSRESCAASGALSGMRMGQGERTWSLFTNSGPGVRALQRTPGSAQPARQDRTSRSKNPESRYKRGDAAAGRRQGGWLPVGKGVRQGRRA